MNPRLTPSGEQIVPPTLPVVPVDLDAEANDAQHLTYSAPALQTDRLMERLGPRRLAEIRTRLASGAYNSPEVMKALAIRLLESRALG